jgi:hypothetical protein
MTEGDPGGPWSPMITVKAVAGWEDPCPFWDDGGRAYLVHSHKGAGPLVLHRMSTDGTRLLDDGVEIYRGPVAEGPKLFKRQGWYYVSLPEGGAEKGGQTVLRSRALYGPYERRQVLGSTWVDSGASVRLAFGQWKGARVALFAHGAGGGAADLDDFRYRCCTTAERP